MGCDLDSTRHMVECHHEIHNQGRELHTNFDLNSSDGSGRLQPPFVLAKQRSR